MQVSVKRFAENCNSFSADPRKLKGDCKNTEVSAVNKHGLSNLPSGQARLGSP